MIFPRIGKWLHGIFPALKSIDRMPYRWLEGKNKADHIEPPVALSPTITLPYIPAREYRIGFPLEADDMKQIRCLASAYSNNVIQEVSMKGRLSLALAGGALLASAQGFATGLATCDLGPRETWQPQAKLEKMLSDRGWRINRIKEDGGCYEVYAIDEKGQRVEAYFHPKTLAPVPTKSSRR